jgi:hypothetical protein
MSEAAPTDVKPANGRGTALRVAQVAGGVIGYGSLAAFLTLLGIQVYRWFRDGEWTHFGVVEGLRSLLTRCCVQDGDTGRLAAFVHWLDAPVAGLGLHKVLELLPASLALFAVSVFGNSVFIYCSDRLADAVGAARADDEPAREAGAGAATPPGAAPGP